MEKQLTTSDFVQEGDLLCVGGQTVAVSASDTHLIGTFAGPQYRRRVHPHNLDPRYRILGGDEPSLPDDEVLVAGEWNSQTHIGTATTRRRRIGHPVYRLLHDREPHVDGDQYLHPDTRVWTTTQHANSPARRRPAFPLHRALRPHELIDEGDVVGDFTVPAFHRLVGQLVRDQVVLRRIAETAPPAGYRLLSPGEITRTGDLRLFGGEHWGDIGAGYSVAHSWHDCFDRPIARPLARVPEGRTLRQQGETIDASDLVYYPPSGEWEPVGSALVGVPVSLATVARHAVPPLAGWRYLRPGDPVQSGDKYLLGSRWVAANFTGFVGPKGQVIRRVDPPLGYAPDPDGDGLRRVANCGQPPTGWRFLEPGEDILVGDCFWDGDAHWEPVASDFPLVGTAVENTHEDLVEEPYIRPIR